MERRIIKSLVSIIILVLLIQIVSASALFAIGMQGISKASPEIASAISNVICVSNPVGCVQGKIVGMVQSEALSALAEENPEMVEAFSTYNQVETYVEAGAEITQDLEVNEEGGIEEGIIQFGGEKDDGKEKKIGNLVGEGLNEEDISVQGDIEFIKKEGASTFTFKGGDVKIKGNEFKNIQPLVEETEETSKKEAFVKLDERGEVMECDFTTNEKGGSYVIGNDKLNVPPNSRVLFKDGKAEILVPDNGEIKELPSLADTSIRGNLIEIKGKDVKLPQGMVLESGVLSYKDGQAFISEKNSVIINGVEIDNQYGSNKINIFTDGKKHDIENYISLAPKPKDSSLAMKFGSETNDLLNLKFKENNPFVKIEGGDLFEINPRKHSEILINGRDSLGEIPEVIARGNFKIIEDSRDIIALNDKIFFDNNLLGRTTSPIELKILRVDGSSAFGGGSIEESKYAKGLEYVGESQVMRISNFNEFAIGPENKANWEISPYEGSYLKREISPRLTYNYPTIKGFEESTGKEIRFINSEYDENDFILEGEQSIHIRKISDFYETLSPETKGAIGYIGIGTEKSFSENGMGGAAGVAFQNDRHIELRADVGNTFGTFKHESAHTLDYSLRDPEASKKMTELIGQIEENQKFQSFLKMGGKDKSLIFFDSPEMKQLKQEYTALQAEYNKIDFETLSEFSLEWDRVSQVPYGEISVLDKNGYWTYQDVQKDVSKLVKAQDYETIEQFFSPKEGLVRPYGGSQPMEDVATFVEKIGEPEFFKPLINPESPQYDIRYEQKLAVLHKYDFISDAEYSKILETGGIK